MTENDTLPPLPPPPLAPPIRPPLRRSRTQSIFGGVSGGIAEHTGIDVLLFRVGFVVLTFAGGAGIVLYAALWLLLPDADGGGAPLRRWIDQRPASTARNIAMVVAAVVVLSLVVGAAGLDGAVLVLAALAILAYLWHRDRDRVAPGHAAPTATMAAPPADATTGYPAATSYPAVPDYPITSAAPTSTATPAPRRQRSRLGPITVSLLLVVLGVLAIADRNTDLAMSTAGYLGAALGVVGAGLLVGTFWGRSRGLILLGIPLLAVLVPVSAFDISLEDGVGERFWSVSDADDLQSQYRLGAGHGQLDLTGVDFTGADAVTAVSVNLGYAEVLVPADVDVIVRSSIRGGEVTVFERDFDGSQARRTSSTVSDDGLDGPGGGQLEIVVDVNFGVLEVTRVR